MLDPLTAFGLAANIVQFLDLGAQLVRTGYEAYKSSEGLKQEDITLDQVTKDILKVSQDLDASLKAQSGQASDSDAALEDLAHGCQAVAGKLIDALEKVRVKDGGKFRGWEALRKSLRAVTKGDRETQALVGQLNEYRQQISLRLLAVMRDEQSSIRIILRDLEESNARFHMHALEEMQKLRKELVGALAEHRAAVERYRYWEKATAAERASEKKMIEDICKKMDVLVTNTSPLATEFKILDSLYFPQIENRHSAIKKTYADTFAWIFDKKRTPFKTWLEEGSGIFWVRGKAGSGKSTLMKYLSDHGQTSWILSVWAGEKRLVTASYYFWSAGTPMQKSEEGLLQSLLFQLLSQCSELIPIAAPKRWEADNVYHRYPHPWTREELSETLQRALSQGRLSSRFCFFIDGLDEYSGDYHALVDAKNDTRVEADHYQLVEDLKQLAASADIKLCVSSRPWNSFRNAFGDAKDRMFVLEELTMADMDKYITGMLQEDARFLGLAKRDPDAYGLVSEIREKAQGVFLWVYLAVRSLLRGLSEADDVSELRRRLHALPSELADFFDRMLRSIDPAYQQMTCRLLALAYHASVLPVMAFYYLKLELDDPDYALKAKVEPFPPEHMPQTLASAVASVNKWCRDLLEVVQINPKEAFVGGSSSEHSAPVCEIYNHYIEFLHRTVKEYLEEHAIQAFMTARVGHDYCAEVSMCRVYLADIKTLPLHSGQSRSMSSHARSTDLKIYTGRFLNWATWIGLEAKRHEKSSGTTQSDLLAELDYVGQVFKLAAQSKHWTNVYEVHVSPGSSRPLNIRDQGQSNFLAFAVCHDLQLYVAEALQRDPSSIRKAGRPLLDYALHPTFDNILASSGPDKARINMMQILLQAGADVNEKATTLGAASIWHSLLFDIYHGVDGDLKEVVELFIDHYADMDSRVLIRQPASSTMPVMNFTGSRETRMDMMGGELVDKEYATVEECLGKAFSLFEIDGLMRRKESLPPRRTSVTPGKGEGKSWIGWLVPWSSR